MWTGSGDFLSVLAADVTQYPSEDEPSAADEAALDTYYDSLNIWVSAECSAVTFILYDCHHTLLL